MSDIQVEVHPDTETLTAAAARRFVDTVVAAQQSRGFASVVLTGGGTGIGMLEKVRVNPGAIDWRELDIFWGDERFLPAGDPERNDVQARAALLDHVDVDFDRVHTMPVSDGIYADDPEAAAVAYAQVLGAHAGGKQVPVFDVHLLGMGGEGHVNSLFPDTDAVREEHRFVVAVKDSPKPPPVRITLTLPAVRHADEVWLVVSGEAKAEAVAAAVAGAPPVEIPASGARGLTATRWLLDSSAASRLPN
ncbi:6-phosphogluconolactonase [Rhodococcus tibetensis]|uniref:6-phosphogluconolactonase n=1 Tax=Rhodococcus tibetensis TaxID=2965064 RepID=A0ABT1QBM4_9NOCA|nr:6-phosphogluconolactonase [Rhodococcus sp. FXJ9.536]MCQ4118542.1 6-phosphogluconolactonase [Rhodococcus sp. FXJ9.536]